MRDWLVALAALTAAAIQPVSPVAAAVVATLQDGQVLHQGDFYPSSNMEFYVELQGDGDLVIHRGSTPSDDHGAIWSSAKADRHTLRPADNRGQVWGSDRAGGR